MTTNINDNNNKKATLFTDPLGNTCLKYDLIEIELNNTPGNNEQQLNNVKTIIRTQNELNTSTSRPRITRKTVRFLTRLSLITFLCFLPTGIPSVLLAQQMKKHYMNCDYEKAIKYKWYAKICTYSTILLGILTFTAIMICIPLF